MGRLLSCLFVVAAVINLVPVVGVSSAGRLEAMYRVALPSADLVLLMRHRAVLFAIVGGLLLAAAWRRELRSAAIVAGLASMLSFVVLAVSGPEVNPALVRVTQVDVVGLVALSAAAVLHWGRRPDR